MRVWVQIDARAAVRAGGSVLRGSASVECDLSTWTEDERAWLSARLDPRASTRDEVVTSGSRVLLVAEPTDAEVRASVGRWIAREAREAADAAQAAKVAQARAQELTSLAQRWLARDLKQQREERLLSDEATREALLEVMLEPLEDWGYPRARRVRASDLEHEDGCAGEDSWVDLWTETPTDAQPVDLSSGAYSSLLHLRDLAERLRSMYAAESVGVEPRLVRYQCDRCKAEGCDEVACVRLAWGSGLSISAVFTLD